MAVSFASGCGLDGPRMPGICGRKNPFQGRAGYDRGNFRRELTMIQIGERIPHTTLNVLRDGVQAIGTDEIFAGKNVVLFSVPGAFTPTCSAKHLPGFVDKFEQFKAHGVDVACMAVNDAFVMDAWSKQQNVPTGLTMLADGNGAFTKAMGLEMDASAFGMGLRSKRFALYAEDGVVKKLLVEAPGEFKVSSADAVLKELGLEKA
jgi:peroxiredoxin